MEVVLIEEERSLIVVKGGVPGSIGGWVEINDAKKKSLPANVPYPAGIKNNQNENIETKQINNDEKKEESPIVETKNLEQNIKEAPKGNEKKNK